MASKSWNPFAGAWGYLQLFRKHIGRRLYVVFFLAMLAAVTEGLGIALVAAVRNISRSGVKGDLVECGVWRGGSMMAVAVTLLQVGDSARDLYLSDTFSGMAKPGPQDIRRRDGQRATELCQQRTNESGRVTWA